MTDHTALALTLPDDLWAPSRLPLRDKDGFVFHPDCDLIFDGLKVDDEGEAACAFIKKLGYEFSVIELETDATYEVRERYFSGHNSDCSFWEPSRPEGSDWLLAWITDSENGPIAVYLRKPPAADEIPAFLRKQAAL